MPIISYKGLTHYFCHIPKCGGSSIENYMAQIDGVKIGFLDRSYVARQHPWNSTSPQHILNDQLNALFPVGFFDTVFVVVRHPFSRFVSAFKHNKYRNAKDAIPGNKGINEFIAEDLEDSYLKEGWFDNHFYPQVAFVPKSEDYRLFKLENGLSLVKDHIDQTILCVESQKSMPHSNESIENLTEDFVLTDASKDRLARLYAADFIVFDYPPRG